MEDKAGVKAPPAGGPGRHPGRLCATAEDDEELEMLRGELQRTQAQLKQAQQQASLGSSELDHLQGMAAQSLANMDAYEETRAQLELLRHPSAAGKAVPGK
ncbi:hypothetical protein WJX72_008752 [[Myrmecia] bisecta]|uniref:Uncharacterized protein n=1 Tax=[Myrmecia] bisecta TaxID=41462 RepID=A0AAW1Q591_9CHLO